MSRLLNEHYVTRAGRNNNGTQPVFRVLDARASSAATHVTSNNSQDHGRVLRNTPTSVLTTSCSLERDRGGFDFQPFMTGGVPQTKTTQLPQGRRNVTLPNKERMVLNMVLLRGYQHNVHTRYRAW